MDNPMISLNSLEQAINGKGPDEYGLRKDEAVDSLTTYARQCADYIQDSGLKRLAEAKEFNEACTALADSIITAVADHLREEKALVERAQKAIDEIRKIAEEFHSST